jgi:hypothetical protein
MTRIEYIEEFTKHINSSLRSSLFGEDYAASMIKAFLVEHDAFADGVNSFNGRTLLAEIDSLKQEPTAQAIIYGFVRSRMLTYLVSRDNLSKFGTVENHPTSPNTWCRIRWINDVFADYTTKSLIGNYAHRWMYSFYHHLGYIIASGAKMHLAGDVRNVPSNSAAYVYKVPSTGTEVLYNVASYLPARRFEGLSKKAKLIENQNTTTVKTQLFKALKAMKSVSRVEVETFEDASGKVVYAFSITLAQVKIPNQVKEPKVQEPKPATFDEAKWTEAINNVPNNARPEVIALERAYSEALEHNKILTEAYTKAKNLWEESTNRLDRLEQALELVK